MRTNVLLALGTALLLTIYSCNSAPAVSSTNILEGKTQISTRPFKTFPSLQPPYSRFIPVDSANRMISSYLESIDYTHNDTDLKSLVIDVDSLEKYIRIGRASGIKNIKLMFAHSLEYINAGNYGKPAGYRNGALTLIVSGYNQNGDYVIMPKSMVLDYSMPCPTNCLISGSAANNLIIVNSAH